MEKVDLNAPAFGPGSQSLDDLEPQEQAVEEAVAEPTEEVKEEAPKEESVEETKVPYSRFKKFHDEAKKYQEEADYWKAKAEEPRYEPQRAEVSEAPPNWWVKLYGDSAESAEAWMIQEEANQQLRAEAREEAIRAVKEQGYQEELRTKENLEVIDTNLELLQDFVGRELSEKEQSAVLDIVDEYTPKDDDGNYAGAILPFEKAWEILQLKNQASKAPRNKARDSVASLTGTSSQGSTSIDERNADFNPLDWNSWKKRI